MSIRLLVLDIDETLVETVVKPLSRVPDLRFKEYAVYRRPHLTEFLEYCFGNFDVGIWSSARKRYVTFISETIFALKYDLKFVWSEEYCDQPTSGESSIKDLRRLRVLGYVSEEIVGRQ